MKKRIRYSALLFIIALIPITIGILILSVPQDTKSVAEELTVVKSNLEHQLNLANESLAVLESYLEENENLSFDDLHHIKTSHSFYIYNQGILKYWSTHKYVPKYVDLIGDYHYKYLENRKGKFVAIKKIVTSSDYEIIVLVPLFFNSLIENQYLFSEINKSLFRNDNVEITSNLKEEANRLCVYDKYCLFNVVLKNSYFDGNIKYKSSAIIGIYIGIFLIVILIVKFSNELGKLRGGWLGIVVLVFSIGGLRAATLAYDWQINAFDSTFYNPQVFASSYVTPTLADLLVNMSLLLGVVFFALSLLPKHSTKYYKLQGEIIPLVLGGISGTGLWQLYLLTETIYYNSNYTLDITSSIVFSKERILILFVLIMSAILFFLFSHIVYKFYRKNELDEKSMKQQIAFVVGLILFGIVIHLIGQTNWNVVFFSLSYFIVLRLTKLPENFNNVSYQSFTYMLIGVMFTSALFSLNVKDQEEKREEINKIRFANQFLIGNDELAEYLLLETSNNIANDAFIKSRMFTPFLSKEAVKEKVSRVFLSNYFDKYDVDIFLFSTKGHAYDENNDSLNELREKYEAKPIDGTNEFYLINNYKGEYIKGYVSITEIKNYGISAGYIVITLKLKKIIPENVYPDLLVDSRFLLPFENKNYSYAIFADNHPIYSSGEYNYERDFNLFLEGEESNRNGYNHTVLDEEEGRKIILSSQKYDNIDVFSNFSFLTLTLIFFIVVLLLFYGSYFFFSGRSLNYSARIQLYFNWAFFLPLMAISSVTLSLITESYQEEIEFEHYKKAMVIGRNIENEVSEGLHLRGEELKDKLNLASTLADTDANLFDTEGRLIASSQPLIYKKNVLSEYMPPKAIAEIVENNNHSFTSKESVGSLDYNTTYIGIKSPLSGEQLAVLSVPYFQSEFNLEKEKIEVFTTIVNVFIIVFIVFLVISYFASKWLTFPLRFITEKLKDTKLSEINKPLKWESNDEIGLMVREYNRMIVNLDESKKALARTEKETAWRKIAQQVAHEIKNPLTPMKLTLQQLQRVLLQGSDNMEFKKPVKSLLHQVDTLSDIVSSFSSFAQMPIPEHERYEIINLIRKTLALHKGEIKITEELPNKKLYGMGDEKLMGRIILNMILNAEQSSENEVVIKVEVRNILDKKVLIKITDNGDGIPNDIVDKIFIPNFTTKATGSGIGLAIAKHGIEHAGGEIWFETNVGHGTTFNIELPQVM